MITKPTIYTEEFVKEELNVLYELAKKDKKMVVMGELFEKRPYSAQRFSEWTEKFKDNEEISESIKKIKELFELRLNMGGLTRKLHPTMTIFNLKNNYGWKDENTTKVILPKPLDDIPENNSLQENKGFDKED